MDGRLAPYLAQNQARHHAVPRRDDDGAYLPTWRPSPGPALRARLKAVIGLLGERTHRPTPPRAGADVPGPVHSSG